MPGWIFTTIPANTIACFQKLYSDTDILMNGVYWEKIFQDCLKWKI